MMKMKYWKYIAVLLAGSAILFVSGRAERAAAKCGCPICSTITSSKQNFVMANGSILTLTALYSPAEKVCVGSGASLECLLDSPAIWIIWHYKGQSAVQHIISVKQCFNDDTGCGGNN